MKKVLFFNPRAAESKARVPNSILSIAASIEGKYDYAIVDGNLENNPLKVLLDYLDTGEYHVFASTVMPGPQLKQAIPFTKEIRRKYPRVKIIWGGYFPSNHSQVTINSGYIDYIIYFCYVITSIFSTLRTSDLYSTYPSKKRLNLI